MFKKLRKKYLATATIFGLTPLLNLLNLVAPAPAQALDCPDVKLIFARGSGEIQDLNQSFLTLNAALASKLQNTDLKYQSKDLYYPAPAVGFENLNSLLVTLGAAISGGESYEFGRSVTQGANQLAYEVNSNTCPNTKYVLAGYSQGAMVLDKALRKINPDKVLYAATFGDPKLYLPEGKGTLPDACRGQNLSDYRMYVPECHIYQGILGGYIPYRAETLIGKIGTWCEAHDIMCSSGFNLDNHTGYIRDGLYEDASRVMYAKIVDYFGFDSKTVSPHDTAILIDSTGSMSNLINSYKQEALRLAEETLSSGGRVALYSYRDLQDHYDPVEHCNFDTCSLEVFQSELDSIKVQGGGDTKESLLSASMFAMQSHTWRYGATKSLVVLTDAGFHNPDFDNTTLADVVAVSKSIDPVNFYIITKNSVASEYAELAEQTGGQVVTNLNELSLLTDYIMDRYDSLPRVEESSESLILPTLTINQTERIDEQTARISYSSDVPRAMVFLNDVFLGITDQTELVLSDLRADYQNVLTLVPITDSVRGDAVSVELNDGLSFDDLVFNNEEEQDADSGTTPNTNQVPAAAIPLKAPNTGLVSAAKVNR